MPVLNCVWQESINSQYWVYGNSIYDWPLREIEWNLYDLGVYMGWYRRRREHRLGSLDPEKYHLQESHRHYYTVTALDVPWSDVREHYMMENLQRVINWGGKGAKGGVKSFKRKGHTNK